MENRIYDRSDQVCGTEPNLLINTSTGNFLRRAVGMVRGYDGCCSRPTSTRPAQQPDRQYLGLYPARQPVYRRGGEGFEELHGLKRDQIPYLETCGSSLTDAHYLGTYISEPELTFRWRSGLRRGWWRRCWTGRYFYDSKVASSMRNFWQTSYFKVRLRSLIVDRRS